jgi:hypothetical protein
MQMNHRRCIGVGQSAVGTVVGVYNIVRHPINTAEAIYNAVGDPGKQVMTTIAVANTAVRGYEKFKSGNANVKANMIGKLGGDIAQLAIGAGEAKVAINGIKETKALGEAGQVGKIAAEGGGQLGFKELQTLTKTYSAEMNAFFKSGGTQAASKEGLQAYQELATRILNGTGGAPASKLTETALKVQTQRLEMINKAIQNIK